MPGSDVNWFCWMRRFPGPIRLASPTQADIATFSKFIRTEQAERVVIEDLWFETPDS